jgi:very-short-patch-repair endonuclease
MAVSKRLFGSYWKLFKKKATLVEEHKFHEKRKFRFDYAFIDERVAVEEDGGQWGPFGGRHNRDSDREKINLAIECGWVVLRYSTQQLEKDPLKCIEQVEKVLLLRKGISK